MGIVKFAVGILLGIVLICTSAAASGFENTAVGTSAAGMGGAYRSIADDWTASYYNPAGLAWLPRIDFPRVEIEHARRLLPGVHPPQHPA